MLSLDVPAELEEGGKVWYADRWTGVPDFIDKELDRIETEEAIDKLFSIDELTDTEKMVLSLHYELFHRSLCGAEITTKGEAVFTYPYTPEDFHKLLGELRGLRGISLAWAVR